MMIDFRLKYIRFLKRFYNYSLGFLYWLKPSGPKVYLFHEIVEDISQAKNEYIISEASFIKFLKHHLEKGTRPHQINEIAGYLERKEKSSSHNFAITFDDVYESVFTRAYPILKTLNIPFILFITVELLDKPNYLKKEQLLTLAEDPLCTIGSHGFHHAVFRKLSHSAVEKELIESKKYLEKLINRPVEVFAFPYGTVVTVSKKNVRQLSKSVYKFGFSAITGSLNQKWFTSKFFLPRINVDEALVKKITAAGKT
jgi:peptidoglycan/xylan/chitin deacetylase (PgdA/CDA1 family)